MMPMPPSSATAIAISARVTVSMLAETIGRFSVRCSRKRHGQIDGGRVAPLEDAVLRREEEVVERGAADDVREVEDIDGVTQSPQVSALRERDRRERIDGRGAQQRDRESPIHRDEDGERGTDDRKRAIDAPTPGE